jgi:hypothetical protein
VCSEISSAQRATVVYHSAQLDSLPVWLPCHSTPFQRQTVFGPPEEEKMRRAVLFLIAGCAWAQLIPPGGGGTAGGATASNQTNGNQKTQVVGATGNVADVDVTGAVKVAATISTAGLATEAKQDTGNTSLGSIDGKTPALGQALAAASVPVVLTAAQVATLTPPAAITGFATEATLSTMDGKIPSLVSGRTPVDGSGVTQPVSGTFWQATQPVSLASLPALAAGTNNIGDVDVLTLPNVTVGTFPDNEPFNVAQINGITPLMGAGNTGTGSMRVTLATDQAALPTWGMGATGAAPPVNAQLQGGLGSGATAGLQIAPTICDQWVAINGTASVQLIAGVSGRKIYVCSGNLQMNGGANTVSFVSGTGSVCATGITAVPGFDGATTAANGYSFAANSGMTWAGANGAGFARTTNNADNLCILIGTATRVVGGLSYAIY